jgi:hypothetical protein
MNKISKKSMWAGALGAVAVGAFCLSSGAMAQVRIGVNIGVPAPVYVAPAPVYAPPPPPVVYAPPPPPAYAYAPPPVIVVGWHGDRYYDGRRYWDRDDWNRHHGHDDHHDDHHDHGHHNGWH